MKLAVVGIGYVGLVTAAVFADLGNQVDGLDIDQEKIEKLKKGQLPFYEPGLKELLQKNIDAGRLKFTAAYQQALTGAEIVFICVGTPAKSNGDYNLDYVFQAAKSIAQNLTDYTLVVIKSTVPPGTNDQIREMMEQVTKTPFDLAACPEFLREGSAVADAFQPSRIVIGADNYRAVQLLKKLHQPIKAPQLICDPKSSQTIKYAANAFLSTKISFINLIARLCDQTGADIVKVAEGLGLDPRIGREFLQAGLGYGGSCLSGDEKIFVKKNGAIKIYSIKDFFEINRIKKVKDSQILGFEDGKSAFSKIKYLTERFYSGDLLTIKTGMGKRLDLTADHPMIVYDQKENSFKTILAKDIRKGDSLVTLTSLPRLRKKKTINLIDQMGKKDYQEKALLRPMKGRGIFTSIYDERIKEHVDSVYLRYPHDIKRKNYLPFSFYCWLKKERGFCVDESQLRVFNTTTYCPGVFEINENFTRFLGYYLAEGWISQDYGRHNSLRERVGVCFGVHEEEYIGDVEKILKKLQIKYMIKNDGSSFSFIISSKPFAFLLRDVLGCGVNSYDKKLPFFAFNLEKSLKIELLRGLFSGDGHIDFIFKKYPCLEFATVSRDLAEGVVLLLQSLGTVASLKIQRMNKSKTDAFIVRVSGFNQVEELKKIFGLKKEREIDKSLNFYKKIIKSTGCQKHDFFASLLVKKIKSKRVKNYPVYSAETETNNFFTSWGVLVHNCFPKDTWALTTFAKQQKVDFGFLRAVDKINRTQIDYFSAKISRRLGGDLKDKAVAVLGLAFKPETDDLREARSILLIKKLQRLGAKIKAYDPAAMNNAKKILKKINYAADAYQAVKGADILVLVTEWEEFHHLNWLRIKELMRQPIVVDGRNFFNPEKLKKLGFIYEGVGRR